MSEQAMLLGAFPSHSLSLHNADNFGSFAGMLDQQFASFHKSLRRKEETKEEEIRYVLERVQTSPGLTLLFSILRQNENNTRLGMSQRLLDKCFRFAEKTRRHVYYGMTGGALRFLGKKLRIPGNRARFDELSNKRNSFQPRG